VSFVHRRSAAIESAAFLLVAPGTVLGLVPWLLSRWEFGDPVWAPVPVRVLGGVLLVAGVAQLLHSFGRFVIEGIGTPSPFAPPRHLVVGGFYRFVRNPMYVAVCAGIVGQGLLFGKWGVLVYAVCVWLAFASFVRWREEPALHRRFGTEYETYRRSVRAWLPRLRPWDPSVLGTDRVTAERGAFG